MVNEAERLLQKRKNLKRKGKEYKPNPGNMKRYVKKRSEIGRKEKSSYKMEKRKEEWKGEVKGRVEVEKAAREKEGERKWNRRCVTPLGRVK